jgi:type I site-specific restriction endonuclease
MNHRQEDTIHQLTNDRALGLVRGHAEPAFHAAPFQVEANTAIEQAVTDRKRQMLVAMATGTGKTFTLVNEIYRLMKSGAARRILVLVDILSTDYTDYTDYAV